MKRLLKKGVVLGDFSPVTNAHAYMIEFARRYVDHLTIVIDVHANDEISAQLRTQWLEEMFPDLTVRQLRCKEWHKSNDGDIADDLVRGLRRLVPKKNGHIFCLDARGKPLAEMLGVTFVPLDPAGIGLTATERQVRQDPLKYWEMLPRCVRPHYVRRVCVFGPESTGKSTLALRLAKHFNTLAVPEYAKTYIESTGKEIDSEDMLNIARAQLASEDAAAREANRVLFCDSDLVTSILWSGRLTGEVPQWLRTEANRRQYDLYLLTDIDVPFVDDVHRYIPKERQAFFDRCIYELESRDRPFAHVKGGWEERFETAAAAVKEMLSR
jgi:HTH-type transcriptional repressor of NAD biosynthesis genes